MQVTILEHTIGIADFEPWFIAQTSGTPWGPTVAALTDAERQRLASTMTDRVQAYARPGGGHNLAFRSYRLEARVPDRRSDTG